MADPRSRPKSLGRLRAALLPAVVASVLTATAGPGLAATGPAAVASGAAPTGPVAALPVAAPATPPAAAPEPSIRPGVNDSYRDPKLDVPQLAQGFASESREAFAARHAVARAMNLRPGQRIADIGAGTGIYVPVFAEAVGPAGRVYAVDIVPALLDWVAKTSKAKGLTQVTTVVGGDRTSNLPPASVDVVFSSDTYHHFEFPQTMVRDLARALVPGGTMYVLDFERIPGKSSDWILGHVRAGKEVVIREVEGAGFTLVREHRLPELRENYLLEFRRDP